MENVTRSHFLLPSAAVSTLPRPQRESGSSSKVTFSGFWLANRHFITWLEKMEAVHEHTWRRSGIYEAIKASAYSISKNGSSLIFSVAEKWCPSTNTFIFPWGEATITLEDVMVLLGFSVLGTPAFAPLESSELRDSAEKLQKVRNELSIAPHCDSGRVRQSLWTSRFFGRGDHMEHEAFLVLWLSLFVFPGKSTRVISEHVIPIAVRLARGDRIALAPAVLAGIYRDLGQIRDLARRKYEGDEKVNLKSLLKLVLVWTWERFQSVRSKAREILAGEPRIARWDKRRNISENARVSFEDFGVLTLSL